MTMLFVSFTGTLRAIRDGKVTDSDLMTGLFHFGCSREHAFDPSGKYNEVKWFFKNDADGLAVHGKIIDALTKAEAEGRVLWAADARDELEKLGTCEAYRPISNFLVRNGFLGINYSRDGRTGNPSHSYCYPGVAERVEEAGLDLEVIS